MFSQIPTLPLRNLRKESLRLRQDCSILSISKYSLIPLSFICPFTIRLCFAKAFIAASALLLFQGTPSLCRKVQSISQCLRNRLAHLIDNSLLCSHSTNSLK